MLFGVDSFYLRPSPLNLILRRLDQLLGNKVHLAHLGSRRASQRRIELVAELGLYACVDLMVLLLPVTASDLRPVTVSKLFRIVGSQELSFHEILEGICILQLQLLYLVELILGVFAIILLLLLALIRVRFVASILLHLFLIPPSSLHGLLVLLCVIDVRLLSLLLGLREELADQRILVQVLHVRGHSLRLLCRRILPFVYPQIAHHLLGKLIGLTCFLLGAAVHVLHCLDIGDRAAARFGLGLPSLEMGHQAGELHLVRRGEVLSAREVMADA